MDKRKTIINKVKKYMLGGVLVGGLVFGGNAIANRKNKDKDKKEKKTELVVKKRIDLKKKYKITNRADFDSLYNMAKPFVFASLIPSENWRNDYHSDKQRTTVNSVGVGLFYVGVDTNGNLDFTSKDWKKTKIFFKEYQNKHGIEPQKLTPNQIYQGTFGWFENMENGRHLTDLCKHLQGAELTVNEFAAIASVYYNSESKGRSVCKYVCTNYTNPYACARYILSQQCNEKGIKFRRVHETLLYLNFENYCNDMYSFEVDGHLKTSISAGASYRAKLLNKDNFNNINLHAAKEAICNHVVQNGIAIKDYIGTITIKDGVRALDFYEPNTVTTEMDKRGKTYKEAMKYYDQKDYQTALTLFKKVVTENGNSAQLYNDMAITYYHLEENEDCIKLCDKVLRTEESEFYMSAQYNKGLACFKLGQYEKALECFNVAVNLAKESKAKKQEQTYKNMLNKTKKQIKTQKSKNFKNGGKKVTGMIDISSQKQSMTGLHEYGA